MYCTWNYSPYWAQSLIPYLILSQLCTLYTGMIDLFHCSILQPVYIRIGMYQPSFKLVQLCQIIPVRPLTYLIPRWSSGWTPAPHQLHRQPKRLTVQKRRRKLKLHRHVITLDVSNVFAFHFGLVDTPNRFGHTSTCMFAGPKIVQYEKWHEVLWKNITYWIRHIKAQFWSHSWFHCFGLNCCRLAGWHSACSSMEASPTKNKGWMMNEGLLTTI